MSEIFDKIYDEMSWSEVACRLPSDLAISALKRRIENLNSLKLFFDSIGVKSVEVKPLKEHVNFVLNNHTADEIVQTFGEEYHPVLFGWLNGANSTRIKEEGLDKLSIQLAFNLTKPNDEIGLRGLLDKALSITEPNSAHVISILRKADNNIFHKICEPVLSHSLPEVRALPLGVGNSSFNLLSTNEQLIALKAFAKCSARINGIYPVDFKLFTQIKPLERLHALDKYMGYFPTIKNAQVFLPMPSLEEFEVSLFSGCLEFNDLVTKLTKKIKVVLGLEEMKEEEDDDV